MPAPLKSPPPPLWKLIALTAVASAVLALFARSVMGDRGLFEVVRKKSAYRRFAAEVRALREENLGLSGEIRGLRHEPAVIERIAREQLGYARPGEITFILREDGNAPADLTPRN